MSKRLLAVTFIAPLALAALSAQAPPPSPQSMKGVVIKGKAPVSNEILKVKLPRPQEADLSNGAHLLVLEDHRLPQVSMRIEIPGAGGYFDPAGMPGVAQLTATLMREGTKTRTSQQVSTELERLAANVSVSADMSSDTATLSGSALTENFDKVLDLTADILLNPTFPEEELARYKTRTKAQLAQQRANPGFLAQELFSRVVFGSHPASRVAFRAAELDQVTRDALAAFHVAHYAPDFAVIGIAGDITLAEAKAKLEAKLAAWKKKGLSRPATADPEPIGPAKVYLVDRANSVQTYLAVGTQSIDRASPDYDVLSLTNNVIGGGPTGRLFINLREDKGFTYGAYSMVSARRYRGFWQASTSVRTEVTEPALAEIVKEIGRMRDEPTPAKEFQDKKRSMVAGFALSLESPTGILSNYMTSWLYKLPADYWDKYPERVMAITEPQVQAAAKKYFDPARIQIVAVGEGKAIGDILKKFGKVEVYDTEGKLVTGVTH
jgi:predicted Zn-dependent peptidase